MLVTLVGAYLTLVMRTRGPDHPVDLRSRVKRCLCALRNMEYYRQMPSRLMGFLRRCKWEIVVLVVLETLSVLLLLFAGWIAIAPLAMAGVFVLVPFFSLNPSVQRALTAIVSLTLLGTLAFYVLVRAFYYMEIFQCSLWLVPLDASQIMRPWINGTTVIWPNGTRVVWPKGAELVWSNGVFDARLNGTVAIRPINTTQEWTSEDTIVYVPKWLYLMAKEKGSYYNMSYQMRARPDLGEWYDGNNSIWIPLVMHNPYQYSHYVDLAAEPYTLNFTVPILGYICIGDNLRVGTLNPPAYVVPSVFSFIITLVTYFYLAPLRKARSRVVTDNRRLALSTVRNPPNSADSFTMGII